MNLFRRIAAATGAAVGMFRATAKAAASSLRDFKGEEISRLTMDWVTNVLKADREIRRSARRLRGRARDLRRNVDLVDHFAELIAENVIGPEGIKLRSKVRLAGVPVTVGPGSRAPLNRPLNAAIEAAWNCWASCPVTVDGRMNLVELQRLLVETVAIDGEVFVRRYVGFDNDFGFALQVIDADQVDEYLNVGPGKGQNEIRMGIEVDLLGKPLAYHVWVGTTPFDEGYAQRQRIPAEEIYHLMRPKRPNQTRAVTWLAPVMFGLRMLQGYIEAELVAARTAAAKMGFFESQPGTEGESLGAASTDEDGKPLPLELDAAPGTFTDLPFGKTLKSWDPQHPNTAFDGFVRAILRMIASGLGVSYHSLTGDLTQVNYSSIRAGLLAEHDHYRRLQHWWVGIFLERVYADWMSTALLAGKIPSASRLPDEYLEHKWTPRGWPWVDPLNDVQSSALAIGHGLGSRANALAEQGLDLEEIFEELAQEKALASEYGIELAPPPGQVTPRQPGPGEQPAAGDAAGTGNGNGNGNGRGHPPNRLPAGV
jgi:lambda family phage portal protein